MKHTTKLTFLIAGVCLCLGLYLYQNTTTNTIHLPPTDGTIIFEGQSEDEENSNRREQYFELMHRTAPDTDWRTIDNKTRKRQYEEKRSLRKLKSGATTEVFGNDELEGEWFERGSKDQSGSITAVDYDVDNDKIYLVSDGGTVWKGDRTSSNWTPQNEDLQFDNNIIKVIDNTSGGKRLLASISKIIYYSDNGGLSWQKSGINFNDLEDKPNSIYVMNDNTVYYLAPSGGQMWLFRSTDRGLNFTHIHTFPHGNSKRISMWSPHDSDELYILDRSTTLYQVTDATVSQLNTNNNLPTNVNNHLEGHKSGNTLTLYALTNNRNVYKSTNSGASWTLRGTLPEAAWDVGIEVSLNNADRLYAGAQQAYRSFDGGASWTVVNEWDEYYDDVANKLHADMMAFGSFYDPSGAAFTLIANHGGISISYDNMVTNTNIALQNLNVSQYYDVVTSDANVNYMYAGTQDQGFQRTNMAANTGVENWEQQVSGDYGHLIFSNNGQSLWAQYPGGSIRYYANPRTGNVITGWTMGGTDKPANSWMLPSAETADYNDNSMYIGGGNVNGGSGNYLITLTYANGSISHTQGTFDFKANANNGGSISAIEASKLDTDRLYVAMDDGTFFYSNNLGTTWSKTSSFTGPGGWWLYGATILASDVTSNLVYYGGSGYSNPAVYKSTNGGQSFTAMNGGLPNTLVHELAANADESLLFAATEVGPYVYSTAQNQWFDMRGIGAPMQRYTSVEYIDSEDVVRFGTYGRGAWDFKVSASGPGNNGGNDDCPSDLTITDYPNSEIHAANTLTCSATIDNGTNVECKAGTLITLSDGFNAVSGSTFHAFIEECTPAQGGECEVLANSSFDTDTDDWFSWACTPVYNNGKVTLTAIDAVSNVWNAGFRQTDVTLTQGKTYTLSMKASASQPRDAILKSILPGGSTPYITKDIALTQSPQTFTFDFDMNQASTSGAFVELLLGDATDEIEIEFISLKESGCSAPPSGGDCQLLANAGFDSDFGSWTASGCNAAPQNDGTVQFQNMIVNVNDVSASKFGQNGITFQQGGNYTLTFTAIANNNRPISAKIQDGAATEFQLTKNQVTTRTLNYTHQGSTTNNGKVEIFLGANGAWLSFDSVELNGPCSNKEETTLAPDIQLYPNPATNNIQVEYELPQSTSANILVFDAFGKIVKNVIDAELQAGHQTLNMDVSDLAAGMYFYTLQANEWKATKKFVIVR